MKERVTFVHDAEEVFESSQLQIENDTLHISSLKAVREHRLILAFQELPHELRQAFKECHELHIKWIAPRPYASTAPFVSRASPGLHIFFTPLQNRHVEFLCPLLRRMFGEACTCANPNESFTVVPKISERFTFSAAYQYFQLLPSLAGFSNYFQRQVCSQLGERCYSTAVSINHADYLDIDFDMISQVFTVSIYQYKPPSAESWYDQISNSGGKHIVEVGVLAIEPSQEIEEQSLGGFLTIVGENERPNPTLFSFPARHHSLSQSSESKYHVSLIYPTGFHPTLRLYFQSNLVESYLENCSLHTYLTLPSIFFPDKYQLSEPLFLASKNLHAIHSVSGETDLEAPDWAVTKWGSAMLVELVPPSNFCSNGLASWDAEIPLHLRYLGPNESGKIKAEIPWPVVFWACAAEEGTKFSVNPFDRLNLGYEGLFGPRTIFYHLNPEVVSTRGEEKLLETLNIPVLNLSSSNWVEKGTAIVMILALVWVSTKLAGVVSYDRRLAGSGWDRAKKSQ